MGEADVGRAAFPPCRRRSPSPTQSRAPARRPGPSPGARSLTRRGLAYGAARREGFPFLRLRSGRTFGPGEGAWWRDVGRAEGERDTEALYRVVRSFDLGDEDGTGAVRARPEKLGS